MQSLTYYTDDLHVGMYCLQVPHFHRIMSSKIGEKRDKKDPLRRNNISTNTNTVPPLVAMLEVFLLVLSCALYVGQRDFEHP